MDESKKNELIGEASFLRGMYYFLLAANFGDVPLRTVPAGDEPDGAMKGSFSWSRCLNKWLQILQLQKLPTGNTHYNRGG